MRDRKDCTHETLQLSQDGEEIIICGDCGWEIGHIGRGGTFHAYTEPGQPVIVVARDADGETLKFGVAVTTTGTGIGTTHVSPCGECEWAESCSWSSDGEDSCHS